MEEDRKKSFYEETSSISSEIWSMFEENASGGIDDDYSLTNKEGLTLLDEETEAPLKAPPLRQSWRHSNDQ